MRLFLFSVAAALVAGQGQMATNPYAHFSATVYNNAKPAVVHNLPAMDIEAEIALAEKERAMTKVLTFGKIHNVSRNFFDVSERTKHANGTLYQAAWRIPNALSLAVHFDQFLLSEGGAVWIVGDTQVLGPYTHETRWREGNFMTTHVPGKQVTILYFHASNAGSLPKLSVDVVTGAFQEFGFNAGICNIQAICANPDNQCNPSCTPTDRTCSIQCTYVDGVPSNDNWADTTWRDREELATVAMASAAGSRFCSGSFINNAEHKPYVLTAAHCGVGSTTVVHHNWRNQDCTSTNNQQGEHQPYGDIQVLTSLSESDMTLLEVGASLQDNVYLAGWSAADSMPADGHVIGLHHPRASNQKISHGGHVVPSRWSGSGPPTHWRIEVWTEATTEPGSSGSPIYDRDGRHIIGQLHGGSAACPALNGFDAYGGIFRSYAVDSTFREAMGGDAGLTEMEGQFY